MGDRKVIIHIDDIGSSIAANRAAFHLLETGKAKSGSVMVPSNGFNDALHYIKQNTNFDIGLHLTLTSERPEEILKWKPTLPPGDVPSLIDNKGYFWASVDDVIYKANPEEIKKELINQFEIIQKAGLNVSHLDSHMGVLLHKKLFHIYKELAEILNTQPFIVKPKPENKRGEWFYGCDQEIDDLAHQGFKIIDDFNGDSLYQGESDYDIHCIKRIKLLQDGTTYFLIHVLDNNIDEISKTPDYLSRQKEYKFFESNRAQEIFKEENIKIITTKEL